MIQGDGNGCTLRQTQLLVKVPHLLLAASPRTWLLPQGLLAVQPLLWPLSTLDMEDNSAVVFCASKTNLVSRLLSRLTSTRSFPLSLQALERMCPEANVVPWPGGLGRIASPLIASPFFFLFTQPKLIQLLSLYLMMVLTPTQLVGWCNPSMLFAELLQSRSSPAQTPTVISVSPELARVLELAWACSSTEHFSASTSSFEFSPHPPTRLQRGVICELIRHLFTFVLIVTEEHLAQRESLM